MRLIEQVWFQSHPAKLLLVPFLLPISALFWCISTLRRAFFAAGIQTQVDTGLPVIVVGNIGVGGNGKTPTVLALIELCQDLGLKPGVISRGYGSKAPYYPYLLDADDAELTAELAGDEPYLIAQRAKIPVVIGADRIADVALLKAQGCNIVIADDGLQHYRLARQHEIIVVDGKRLFGNGLLLPAGPLREGVWRLSGSFQALTPTVIINGEISNLSQLPTECLTNALQMSLNAQNVVNLKTGERVTISQFISEHQSINALAGIGDPNRFFTTLTQLGFSLEKQQSFVDHHNFSAQDIASFTPDIPLLMTEKDAVKCASFANNNCWYLPVDAKFSDKDQQSLIKVIQKLTPAR